MAKEFTEVDYRMTELAKIKDRCVINAHNCWEWRGAMSTSNGCLSALTPRIYATDYTRDPLGSIKTIQSGNRAAWHASTGKPIPAGHRIFKSKCSNGKCVNPDHLTCKTMEQWGKTVAKSGEWKNSSARIKANRALGRKATQVTPELMALILSSEKKGVELVKELGVTETVISRVRTGKIKSLMLVCNPFAGLMA